MRIIIEKTVAFTEGTGLLVRFNNGEERDLEWGIITSDGTYWELGGGGGGTVTEVYDDVEEDFRPWDFQNYDVAGYGYVDEMGENFLPIDDEWIERNLPTALHPIGKRLLLESGEHKEWATSILREISWRIEDRGRDQISGKPYTLDARDLPPVLWQESFAEAIALIVLAVFRP